MKMGLRIASKFILRKTKMREGKKRTERRKREKERNNYVGGKQHVDSGCLEVLRLWATFYISVTAFLFYIFTY